MTRASDLTTWLKPVLISLAGLLVACGGGDDPAPPATNPTTTINGSVVAAPVSGANVVVKDSSGDTLAGPVTTGSNGSYTIDIPNSALSAALMIESSGGTFDDEASGNNSTAGRLAVHIVADSLSTGSNVHLSPASSIIEALVNQHGMTLAEAETAFDNAFGFDPDTSTAPADATKPPADATQAERLAGLRAAAFSQLTMDLGLSAAEQFDLLLALARDIAHGGFDGNDASGVVAINNTTSLPADIQNRFTQALVTFHKNKDKNKTGLTSNKIGILPFAKLAMTENYKIEYIEGDMGAMQGKTMFQLRISKIDDSPVSTMVMLMPMMNMEKHMHGSPQGGCMETESAGLYDCTIYYMMASRMMDGMSMGYWELMIMVGGMMGESTTLYPPVMMAMGDTPRVILKGQADMIMGMAMGEMPAMEEQRNYYLFKHDLFGPTENHTFDLFIAAKENMKNYPAVSVNTVLNLDDPDYQLTVDAMTVEVSTNELDWTPMIPGMGSGHWHVEGITGLTNGMEGKLCVKLSVLGVQFNETLIDEQKTTDGMAPAGDGTNDYSCFTVTPGSMGGGMGGM